MPHLRIETSSHFKSEQITQISSSLHKIMMVQPTVVPGGVMTRALKIESCFLGNDSESLPCIHVEVKLLEGRESSVKNEIGKNLLSCLKEQTKPFFPEVKFSIEIRDMVKEFYYR